MAAAEATTEASVPAAPSQEGEGTARRRGRRRATADAIPVEAPETATPAEAAGQTEPNTAAEAPGGGRRSGRRGRRRNEDAEIATDSLIADDGALLLPEGEEEPEEDGLLLPIAPPAPTYVAPFLVPPAQSPAEGALLPRVQARVDTSGPGLPQIVVDETPYPPFLFFVNAETAHSGEVVDAQIRGAAEAGIHLFSGVMYLPLKNAYGDRSFGATDALIQQILHADPEAFILPRLQCVPTNFWARTHPDQMARYADGSNGDVSLASTEFWADCVDALDALIAHLSDPATPGGDRVIGFQIDRGEWFYDAAAGHDLSEPNKLAFQNWLHARYQFPYALRAAWFDGSVTFEDAAVPAWPGAAPKTGDAPVYLSAREGRWPDFALFSSQLVAQAITGLADAIKTLSEGRLLVAVSYGYTLEFAARNDSGHLALAQVLQSPSVDILAGPNSYSSRGAGSAGAFSAPVDSVALHGKLWLVEDDTKTFLAEGETDDTYNPKIAGGADTRAAHERHFGAALAHGAGVTWMDLWGQGWLDSPDIWRELGTLRDQAARLGKIGAGRATPPDVAVLVDEASLAYLKSNPAGLGQNLVGKTRDLLLRAGASVGFYLQSDVTRADFPDCALYLFVNALRVTTGERRAIRERLHRHGKTLAWLYAPGIFDERGPAEEEIGDTVGMALRAQPWNARLGSQLTEVRHPITERLRTAKRAIGQDEVVNPSFAVSDPQAVVLAEYAQTGAASLAVREHPDGWKSVFLGDPHLSVELLRGLYAYAGVPLYDAQDDVVYARDGVLLVHAPYTGQRTFSLPSRATVYDVAEDRILATGVTRFRAFLRARTTRLFLCGDAEAVAAATGLELPEAEAGGMAEDAPPVVFAPETAAESQSSPDDDESLLPVLDGSISDSEGASEEDSIADGSDAPAPVSASRSRWQRRRAALRARRDADRLARTGEGPAETTAASAPVDMETLLPGLPPRRARTPNAPPAGDENSVQE